MNTQAPHTTHPAQHDHELDASPRPDFQELQAAFKKQGHALHVSADGFTATRWGQSRHLPTLEAALDFLRQIGGDE